MGIPVISLVEKLLLYYGNGSFGMGEIYFPRKGKYSEGHR